MANQYQNWSEVPGLARWSSRTTATDAPTSAVLQRVASVEASPVAPAVPADPKAKAKENIERSVHSASMVNQDGHIEVRHLREMLTALNVPADHCEILVTASGAAVKEDHVHFSDFLSWLFPDGEVPQKQRHVRGTGSMLEGLYAGQLSLEDAWCQASFMMQLDDLLKVHPYLEPGSTTAAHPLQYWVTRCRAAFTRKKFGEAQESLRRLLAGLRTDQRQISEAFRRFDTDGSGHLDEHECKNMCAYLGWGLEEASLIDLDKDGRITLPDFQGFVGRMGGVQQLFEHRRLRISSSRKDVCDHAGLAVGSRVRAHFYCHGHKSRSWREAQVLAVGVEKRQGPMGPVTYGVLLEFGFGYSEKHKRWRARQVVPPTWVLSSVEDASVQLAMREIGLLDDDQAFWALLLPESEMRAVERLTDCQRKALAGVRAHSTDSHEQALTQVKTRFKSMGFEGRELETTLGWIQDMAPVVIHVNLDRMGHFMETDEFYRNQFETKTSNGALDPENNTRKNWERELFGGAYGDAKGFDRCKYGALNVMNDYRGVVKARQYGDSYLVLKDVRLRCTMCSTDSGGMRHNRLGVLDKYAHVLSEYNEKELKGLVEVAMNATAPTDSLAPVPDLLRGSTADPMSDWITIGFPKHAQETGQWFFEVHLREECAAPQVGLLSTSFQSRPGSKTGQGVGDDAHGWAADGLSASRWHGGRNRSWSQVWQAKGGQGNRVLSAGVTVGVAVDLDARKIFFATDGQWDEVPAFSEEDIPLGLALYPAVSLKGRASFCFGPECSFGPLSSRFSHWPGLLGQSRIDMPRIGDEEILSLYKAMKRIQLETELDQTRSSLAKAQAGLEVSRLQLQEKEMRRKDTTKRLEIVQQELESLKSEESDSPVRSSAADAKALLQQKQSKLTEQELQVQRLEMDLKESRELLEKHSQRMAEVHAEATECEMKNKCLAEKKQQLQKDLDERKMNVIESLKEKEVRQKQLDEAEKHAGQLLEELELEEARAAEVKKTLQKSTEDLERDVAAKQTELAELKLQTEEAQKSCSELEQTRSARRKLLEDRTAALQTASARAKELAEELQGTENDLARANKDLEQLQEEESDRSKELEDARSKLSEVQREMLSLQAQVQPSRIDDLEATSKNLASQLESAFQQQLAADQEHEKLKSDLEENQQMLRHAQEEVEKLVKEQEDAQKEVDVLTDEIKILKTRDQAPRLQILQKNVEVNNQELDATRGAIATRALEMEALKQLHDAEEEEDLRKALASIQASNDESQRNSAELFAQLRDLEQRRSEVSDALVNAESEKAGFEKEVAKVRAAKQSFVEEHARLLEQLRSELAEARSAKNQDGKEDQSSKTEARRRLTEEVQAEAQRCAELREELAARQESQIRSLSSDGNADAALEESLQEMSSELVKAQGLARRHRRQEEELRLELGKMKERIKATKDKLLYQEEHLKLQLETLQQLDEQRIKGESEVELLTLGLHQQEEENQALLEANTQLLEEVSRRFGGNLEQWAGFSYDDQVNNEVARYTQKIEQWKQKSQQLRRQKTDDLTRRNQQHEVAVQTLQHRLDQLQKEIIQCNRCAKSWEEEKSKKSHAEKGPTSTAALPGLVIFQRPLPSNHEERKALLIGVNYVNSHAPLKGCVNDIWNLQCLLRHTLRYSPEQLQILADGFDGRPRPDRIPTKANIMAGLEWLVSTAQPGDHLLLVFSGYGCQHPRSPGSEKCESYLVPSDFADELPKGFFKIVEAAGARMDNTALGGTLSADELRRQSEMATSALRGAKGSYRLVSMLEVHDFISRLPKRCRVTVVMDACYAILPGVGPDSPATFRKVDRGYVEYRKLENFISRPRFLELPPLPVQHTPPQLPRSTNLLACTLHCFSGCRLKEWCAEFPIEGTVQGAFSWAFLKAMAQGHFHVGIYQFQQFMTNLLLSLKTHFKHVDQQPVVQLSADASLQDVVLWT